MRSEDEKPKKEEKKKGKSRGDMTDMNSLQTYSTNSYGSFSASSPLNIAQARNSYSSTDYVSPKQASEIGDIVRAASE